MLTQEKEQLWKTLSSIVLAWKSSQSWGDKFLPLLGSIELDHAGAEIYVLDATPKPGNTVAQVRCPLGSIEDLIHMRYFRPTDDAGTITFIQPTLDAIQVGDESLTVVQREELRAVFFDRLQRLHQDHPQSKST